MSKKQMEKELNHGDSDNLFCFCSSILKEVMGIRVDKKENFK